MMRAARRTVIWWRNRALYWAPFNRCPCSCFFATQNNFLGFDKAKDRCAQLATISNTLSTLFAMLCLFIPRPLCKSRFASVFMDFTRTKKIFMFFTQRIRLHSISSLYEVLSPSTLIRVTGKLGFPCEAPWNFDPRTQSVCESSRQE